MSEQNSIDKLISGLVSSKTPEELALGFLRYETVRRMLPQTFGELHKRNISGKGLFDDLVDGKIDLQTHDFGTST